VEVAAWLLDQDPRAAWITERELLREELTAARDLDGRLRRGPGRRPDGVLVRSTGRKEAIEIELTPKRDRTEYDRKLGWYLGQTHYQRVLWFVPSFSLRERLNRVVRYLHMDNVVRVEPLPSGQKYPPGITPDRRRGLQPHRGLTAPAAGSQPAQARVLQSLRSLRPSG
jgi:hypothetical protein